MILDSKIPEGPLAEKWDKHKFNVKLVNPANKRKYDIIVVGTGLAGASASRTARAARTPSPLRVGSMPPRTIRTTATPFTDFSTTPSRVATSAPVRRTSIVWPKFPTASSTNASRRAFLSPASMAVCLPTVHLVVRRYRVRSTPVAKPDSSCF